MTDATNHLARIRELAEQGRKESQYREKHWNDAGGLHRDTRERFEAILHNLNQMEATMDTDTTDDAQWWRVDHDRAGWGVCRTSEFAYLLGAWQRTDTWQHTATVKCPPNATEHDIYQAAIDAWAEAGFAHAPQEAPAPKRVDMTWYIVLASNRELDSAIQPYRERFDSEYEAREMLDTWTDANDYRVVKVEVTVIDPEGEA